MLELNVLALTFYQLAQLTRRWLKRRRSHLTFGKTHLCQTQKQFLMESSHCHYHRKMIRLVYKSQSGGVAPGHKNNHPNPGLYFAAVNEPQSCRYPAVAHKCDWCTLKRWPGESLKIICVCSPSDGQMRSIHRTPVLCQTNDAKMNFKPCHIHQPFDRTLWHVCKALLEKQSGTPKA